MKTKCYWEIFKDVILYISTPLPIGFRIFFKDDNLYMLGTPMILPERNFIIPQDENSTNSYPRVHRWSSGSND